MNQQTEAQILADALESLPNNPITAIFAREGDKAVIAELRRLEQANKELLEALKYWRNDCSGAEPSLSVFEQMVDAAIAKHGGAS